MAPGLKMLPPATRQRILPTWTTMAPNPASAGTGTVSRVPVALTVTPGAGTVLPLKKTLLLAAVRSKPLP
ncbi:hypothetical protein D3C86_1299940 [compost metagenome]